ncbi:uncharacterized protein LOC123555664 [Mercenaria mercenaria]|uniref:uncharacterized protein LOC123555664 n=1 Tax=Mercenaria mercenaria TaxID=6596 RepID=UPI00234E6482|nr:uncharacterized protein LOC123555664 [Mercenaria mercenaria]
MMGLRYPRILGKQILKLIFLILLFICGVQFTRYDRNKSREISAQKDFDHRSVRKDLNSNKSSRNIRKYIKLTKLAKSNIHRAFGGLDSNGSPIIDRKFKYDRAKQLDYIPSVFEAVNHHEVPYISENITKMFLVLPNIKYEEKVAILTPVRNAVRALKRFGEQVGKLTYPHELMSLYFGEDGSIDNTIEIANITAHQLETQRKFHTADVVRLNISGGFHGSDYVRHKPEVQRTRRAHMALARNRLLRFAQDQNKFDHILWIDSDVAELPADLVQQMLFTNSDVVATCCLTKTRGHKMKYDMNSWRETNNSINKLSKLEPDYLVLEGYRKSLRIYLPDLKSEGRVVPLDGVGGCALMVKAKCHRSGLQFPEVVYKHHIETEGLAKMARDMGYSVVGLPFVEVFHEV